MNASPVLASVAVRFDESGKRIAKGAFSRPLSAKAAFLTEPSSDAPALLAFLSGAQLLTAVVLLGTPDSRGLRKARRAYERAVRSGVRDSDELLRLSEKVEDEEKRALSRHPSGILVNALLRCRADGWEALGEGLISDELVPQGAAACICGAGVVDTPTMWEFEPVSRPDPPQGAVLALASLSIARFSLSHPQAREPTKAVLDYIVGRSWWGDLAKLEEVLAGPEAAHHRRAARITGSPAEPRRGNPADAFRHFVADLHSFMDQHGIAGGGQIKDREAFRRWRWDLPDVE